MKIKNKLYLSTAVTIIVVTILLLAVVLTSNKIVKESKKHDLAMKMNDAIFELNIVTYEYLLYHEKRMREQWHLRYNSMKGILEKEEFLEKESAELIHADYIAFGDLFKQITEKYEKKQKLIQEGASQKEISIALSLEKRLATQLLIASQSMSSDIVRLARKTDASINKIQKSTNNLILILMVILTITVVTATLLVTGSIARPIKELIEGTKKIGKGDLDYKIDIKSKDEIGKLAVAFNEMTEKRKQAEEGLKASNQQLQASEQQLQASNQQLRANEQQLRAEITERIEAQEGMKRAAEEWSATFDSTKELISIHGIDHKLVRVNRAFANTFKARAEELVGRNCFEVIHGMTEPRPDCPHSQALKTRKPVKQEYFEPHLGLYLEVSVSPIVNKKGEVFGTVHVVADITERKKMEEDRKKHLHELEVFYKANIGREERILELKNGIKELEGKLGKES